MAKTIDTDVLQKERDGLEQSLSQAKLAVEQAKNQVQILTGALAMTNKLLTMGNDVKQDSSTEIQKSLEESAKDVVSTIGDDAIPNEKLSKDEEQLMRLRKDKT